jgi:hypothetical protein
VIESPGVSEPATPSKRWKSIVPVLGGDGVLGKAGAASPVGGAPPSPPAVGAPVEVPVEVGVVLPGTRGSPDGDALEQAPSAESPARTSHP